MINSIAWFTVAAILEIAGCFSFWLWMRRGASVWLAVLGIVALVGFALSLTRIDTAFAGRAYAAYGGIYIAASLVWLWLVEGQRPSAADMAGAGLSVAGALIIITLAGKR